MNESLTDLIQKQKNSELKAKNQRKELHFVKTEINKLKSEISDISINKLQELKNISIVDLKSLWLKQVESTHLEKNENRLTGVMLPELKNQNLMEKSILEDLRYSIWKERRDFCDRARSFTDQHGFLAPARPILSSSRSISKPEIEQNDNEELNSVENDITELEETLRQYTLKYSDWKNQEEETEKEMDQLHRQTSDEELKTLGVSLQYHQKLTEELELQCASLQQDCDSQEMLSSLIKTAEKTASSVFSSTKTPNITKSFKQEFASTRKRERESDFPESIRQGLQMTRQANVPSLFQFKTPSELSVRLTESKKNAALLERQMTSYFNSNNSGEPETKKPSCTTLEGNIPPIAFTTNTSGIDYKPLTNLNSNHLLKTVVQNSANSQRNIYDSVKATTYPYYESEDTSTKPIKQEKPLKSILKKPFVRQPFIT